MLILAIDDDPSIRRILQLRLEMKGCKVELRDNGPAAIASLSDPAQPKPDLIICDVVMPGMDGYEVCRLVRGLGFKGPFLFLTSKRLTADKVRGIETGADDYILKPFDPHELEAKLARYLRPR